MLPKSSDGFDAAAMRAWSFENSVIEGHMTRPSNIELSMSRQPSVRGSGGRVIIVRKQF